MSATSAHARTTVPPEPILPELPVAGARPREVVEIPTQITWAKRLTSSVVIVGMLLLLAQALDALQPVPVTTLALSSLLLARYFLPEHRTFIRRDKLAMDAVLLLIGWSAMLATLFVGTRLLGVTGAAQRTLFLVWGAATPFVLLVVHASVRLLASRFYRPGRDAAVVVAGVNPAARALAEAIRQDPLSSSRLIGYFDDRSSERIELGDELLLGSLEALPAYVKQYGIQCVYLALPWNAQPRVDKLVDELKDTTASICFVTDFSNYRLFLPRLFKVGRVRGFSICHTSIEGMDAFVKRLFDVIVAAVAILMLAPVLLTIALLIMLTSPGPVVFKQSRYGLDGREITVFKFRTMQVMENDAMLKQVIKDDPRVTPVGAVLRKTSLDELPQLFNVLQGSMSLVGPRPHAKVHNEVYRRLIKGYMIRHKVVPGITGLAQVNGCRGETETVGKMAARVAYDLHYIQNWSFWLDVEILLKTFMTVFRRTNAY